MGPKNKANEAKRIRKRKKSDGNNNNSNEKPNKKTNSTHGDKLNVNKPSDINTQNKEMASPNVAMYESPLPSQLPQQQYMPQYQMQQLPVPIRMPPPNYHQSPTSPCANFFTSTPCNTQQPIQQIQADPNNTDKKLDNLTKKLSEICDKLASVDLLTEKISSFDNTMKNLAKSVETVTKRVDDIEKGMQFINETYESNKNDVKEVKTLLNEIKTDNLEMNENVGQLKTELKELHDRHIDLQTRSMRENLIFSGIPMADKNEESDETERILDHFMYRHLKMDEIGAYQRAHRFGKEYEVKDKSGKVKYMTKSIVCRFQNFKERERVRKLAKELKGTVYGISEQFPKEINDKRKDLWPQYQEARRQRRKVFFKRDRLFVDGSEVFPNLPKCTKGNK